MYTTKIYDYKGNIDCFGIKNAEDRYIVLDPQGMYEFGSNFTKNEETTIYPTSKVEDVKKGELVKRSADAKKTYLRGEYNREAKKYSLTDYNDISAEILVKKGTIPMYYTTEVIQHFIGLNGRVTSMAMPVHGMVMHYDSWKYGSELSIMTNDFLTTNRGKIESNYTLPRPTVLKEITRNGFNGEYYNLAPQFLFSLLMNPQAETLLKANQTALFKSVIVRETQVKKYWKSIKICIRNNYEIKSASTFFDYLTLLEKFGKDLSNSKYVCPSDLKLAHDKLVDKARVVREKQKVEEMKKRAIEQQSKYMEEKAPFFGISFNNGKITIKVIDDVQDFILIGDTLKHCIYSSEYFDKKESLILSATIEDRPIETIEVSLSEMKIVQARGFQNKASQYNKEIKQLINDNLLNQIRKANQQLKSA